MNIMLNVINQLLSSSPLQDLMSVQKEALVDLLTLMMSSDLKIDEKEKEKIFSIFETYWDSTIPLNQYFSNSLNESLAIIVSRDREKARQYIANINNNLLDDKARNIGIKLCKELAKSDRDFSAEEKLFLNEIGQVFKLRT